MSLIRTWLLIALAFAFDCSSIYSALVARQITEWPSPSGSRSRSDPFGAGMAIRGDKAFVGVGAFTGYDGGEFPERLFVFDLGQGPNPVKLGQVELSSSNTLQSISVSGNIACVGTRIAPSAIDLVDISDLSHPTHAGVLFLPNPFLFDVSVTAHETFAYICGRGEMFVADISDPTAPHITATLAYTFRQFVVEGTLGYGIGAGGLKIFDLTDPSTPKVIGSSTAIIGNSILISGSVAFVAASESLSAVDLQNPASPRIISSRYIEGGLGRMSKRGNLLCGAEYWGVALFDVNNLTNIMALAARTTGSWPVVGATPDSFVIFSSDNGLRLLDTSVPTNPVKRGFYPLGSGLPQTRPGDSNVYMAFSDLGLVVADFSQVTNPVVIGHCDIPGQPQQIAFNHDTAYVFDDYGVTLVSVSDPTNPVLGRRFSLLGNLPGDARFQNDRLYYQLGFRLNIYDATDTNVLPLIDYIDDVFAFELHGSTLYTSSFDALRAWDISDWKNHKLLAEYHGAGGSSMAIAGSHLVVSGNVLRVFNILSDGTLALIEKFGGPNGRVAAGASVVAAADRNGISLFEIPEDGVPTRSSFFPANLGDVDRVLFFGTNLFVHSDHLGIQIFDLVSEPSPTITSPARHSVYKSGESIPIIWTLDAQSPDWVVSLYVAEPSFSGRETSITGAITRSASNEFRLDWQVPDYLQAGASSVDAYQIHVRDINSDAQGFSDTFTIIDRPKIKLGDQRSDPTPRIYLSWPGRFNDGFALYSKQSLGDDWKLETENLQISDPDSFHRIEGASLLLPQKYYILLPKTQ